MESKSQLCGLFLCAIFLLLFSPFLFVYGFTPLTIEREPNPFYMGYRGVPSPSSFQNKSQSGINNDPRFRLPSTVKPILYSLRIMPILNVAPINSNYEPWTSYASLNISIFVENSTSIIRMHKDKELISVQDEDITIVNLPSGLPVNFENSAYDDSGLWILNCTTELKANETYEIRIGKFQGKIPASDTGLYRASYNDSTGETRYLATTQFSAIGFRKMLMGFDEPRFKSQFSVAIARSSEFISLSNSNAQETGVTDPILPQGYVWDIYEPTVKMSSYIFAILVANYTFTSADDAVIGKPVRVYGPPEMISAGAGNYTAWTSSHLLKTFQEALNETYVMPKMDCISIPKENYHFSAMENYGHITFRDDVVMYFPGESLETERARSVNVVAHEVMHHWFGNLVTPDWWSFVWLKEGFATYGSFWGMEQVAPEYDPTNKMLYETVHYAQSLDSGAKSHPVVDIAGEEQVNSMSFFDFLAYQKGGSLIRMMEGFLGRDVLIRGMQKYLKAKKFDNAVQDDLFAAINEAAEESKILPPGLDVKTIMDTFTLQKGIPLVRISRASSNKIYISQERYSENQNKQKDLNPDELWEIPVAMATQNQPNFSNHTPALWLHKNTSLISMEIDIDMDQSQSVIVNPEGFGYYRTFYDTQLTSLIQNQLEINHTAFSPRVKSQLIEDYAHFAQHEYIQYETALALTKFLGQFSSDADHVFWTPALKLFTKIHYLFDNDAKGFSYLQVYLLPKIEEALNYLNWTQQRGEHGIKVILRAQLLDWACSLGHSNCAEISQEYFNLWLSRNATTNPIPPDFQSIVYCNAIATETPSNATNSREILEAFKREKVESQKIRLGNSLSCTQDEIEILQLLRVSMTTEFQGSTSNLLKNMARNPKGRKHVFGFLNENWQELVNFTAKDDKKISTKIIPDVITALANHLHTNENLVQVENLMLQIEKDNPEHFNYISNDLKSARDTIKKNGEWMQKNFEPIKNWLKNN